ncbi:MAG: GntR family transcriptional regulator [Lachnospiraceae bacterium]
MSFEFNNQRPIYVQLVEQIKGLILSGEYKEREKLPSVRELATEFSVNPNTMQKALAELETMGLIFTERTNGKYVNAAPELVEQLKEEMAEEKTDDYLKEMKEIGYSCEETIEYLKRRRQ